MGNSERESFRGKLKPYLPLALVGGVLGIIAALAV